jgi:hypothetical protein
MRPERPLIVILDGLYEVAEPTNPLALAALGKPAACPHQRHQTSAPDFLHSIARLVLRSRLSFQSGR